MNDDFLYRIRTEPPAHFAASLKERLDAAPRRRAQALRFGLAVLVFGTAFAMVVPGVRHSIGSLFSANSVGQVEITQSATPPSPSLPTLRVMPPEPKVRGTDAPGIDAPGADTSGAAPAHPRAAVPPPVRPASRPATRRAEISTTPANVNDDQGDTHDASNISDWTAAALAARGREITARDLFNSATPVWPVVTDETGARTVIAVRRALFRVITKNFEPVDAMTRKQHELDRDVVALSAYRLLRLSTMIDEAYAWDTRRWNEIEGVNSLVWNPSGVFRMEIQEFSAASRALLESAANGDPADIWRDANRVSRSCMRCHDGFTTRRYLPPRP